MRTRKADRRSTAPRLEKLETRELLSKTPAKITIQEVPSPMMAGQVAMEITGTSKNDSITIADNGKGTAGNIFVSTGDGTDYTSINPISEIVVLTGKGTDNVTYELQGNLQSNLSELVLIGSGGSVAPGKRIMGGGNLQVTVNIPAQVLKDASLTVVAQPDPKAKTSMTVNESGAVDGRLTTYAALYGGPTKPKSGPVNFAFNSTSNVQADGTLNFGTFAGSNKNTIAASYSGENDGDIAFLEFGSGSTDSIAANVFMTAGSTGTVGGNSTAEVGAGGKKANARLTVYRGADSMSTTGITAVITTSSTKSTAQQTGDVSNMTKGSDTLVN